MKAKYNIGDKVKIVNRNLKSFDEIGVVAEIDTEWHIPYVVDFGDKKYDDEELFYASDLILADEEERKFRAAPIDFIDIKFQEGVVHINGVNGAQIEDVIDILVDRLQGFQNGDFPCRENALAITHLQEAQNWLYRRTMERKKQGVEGKYEEHE